jgi:prevent-host-death family protein
MEEVSIEEARRKLGHIVDRAQLAEEHAIITRHGRPAAAVVGYEWLLGVGILIEDAMALEEYRDRAISLRVGRRAASLLPQDNRVVHHKDGDPNNNDLANLEIINPAENRKAELWLPPASQRRMSGDWPSRPSPASSVTSTRPDGPSPASWRRGGSPRLSTWRL